MPLHLDLCLHARSTLGKVHVDNVKSCVSPAAPPGFFPDSYYYFVPGFLTIMHHEMLVCTWRIPFLHGQLA